MARATVLNRELVAVDGAARAAVFETVIDGERRRETVRFDLLHVVPPQRAPGFIRDSALGNAAGWLDVDSATLRHVTHTDIFGLGDCTSTPNSRRPQPSRHRCRLSWQTCSHNWPAGRSRRLMMAMQPAH